MQVFFLSQPNETALNNTCTKWKKWKIIIPVRNGRKACENSELTSEKSCEKHVKILKRLNWRAKCCNECSGSVGKIHKCV